MKTETQNLSLSHLTESARRAFYWTSFNPEQRGSRIVEEYSKELDSDLETLTKYGSKQEQLDRYKADYEKMLLKYLHSHANVASSAIAGPANFHVARNQKRSNWADNHFNAFREFRTKVFKAYEKGERKKAIENAGGELEVAKQKLIDLENLQEYMKRINKEQDFIIKWFPRYEYIKKPFQTFSLTNNLAKIKNTRSRIAELEKKEDNKATGNKEIVFEGGILTMNYELDRVCIKHDIKPEREVIQSIKSSGFNWSPFHKVWMRKITPEAVYKAEKLLNIKI